MDPPSHLTGRHGHHDHARQKDRVDRRGSFGERRLKRACQLAEQHDQQAVLSGPLGGHGEKVEQPTESDKKAKQMRTDALNQYKNKNDSQQNQNSEQDQNNSQQNQNQTQQSNENK